jgi:hypothetical protein
MTNNAMFFHLEPGEYVCWVDASTVDVTAMAQVPLPPGVVIHIVAVACNPGQTISQAVLLMKADAMDKFILSQHKNPWDDGQTN